MHQAAIAEIIKASVSTKEQLLANPAILKTISDITSAIVQCFRAGGKVLFCGNGGSAADAQHLSAEFSGRFYVDRRPLPSEALHCNTSYLTAVANDYGYDEVYARLVKGMGNTGDILISLSTSGTSANILKAIEAAAQAGMVNIGFTGSKGTAMASQCHHAFVVPSADTPRIQECHLMTGHIICQLVEATLFTKANEIDD